MTPSKTSRRTSQTLRFGQKDGLPLGLLALPGLPGQVVRSWTKSACKPNTVRYISHQPTIDLRRKIFHSGVWSRLVGVNRDSFYRVSFRNGTNAGERHAQSEYRSASTVESGPQASHERLTNFVETRLEQVSGVCDSLSAGAASWSHIQSKALWKASTYRDRRPWVVSAE